MTDGFKDFPVDIVYLWCNSNDIDWKIKKNNELLKYNIQLDDDSINACRFIDNDELKYSLRSLEKFAPWINNIFIVTDNQIPEWLNTDNPKIHIVSHYEILPKECLPTFNASAIETAIHKIPNLSEHFLFANDDMFFGSLIDKSFFFDENGVPIFRFSKRRIINKKYKHLYGYMVSSAYRLVKEKIGKSFPYFPHHNIDAYKKSTIINCIEDFKEYFYKTACQKFREKDCVQRSVYEYYAIAKGEGQYKIVDNFCQYLKYYLFHKPFDSLKVILTQKKLSKFSKYDTHLFCLNDSQETKDADRLAMKIFLEKKFPEPSVYEKQTDIQSEILVCYHKPFRVLKNNILNPIQVGSENANFDLGMLKDNTGENISKKNKYYSELTALYWLWKNSNVEYKGLVHYRRFFDLSCGNLRWVNKIPEDFTEKFCLTQSHLKHIFCNYDIILPMKRVISKFNSNYEQYSVKHVISDFDKVLEIIQNKYPEMYDIALKTMHNSRETYLYNMFITKKEIFDNYSQWLFDILFTLENDIQTDVNSRNTYQQRAYGFLAERLLTIYVSYYQQKGLKIVEMPVIYCEENKKRYNIFKYRKQIYKVLVKFGIRRPHWKEQYGI